MNSPTVIFIITAFFSLLALSPIYTAFSQQQGEIKQIIISDAINSYADYGEYTDTAYREFYNPLSAFDNIKNSTYSFWSQYGKAGFGIDLKTKIKDPVCSVEIDVFNPKNSPFTLTVGDKVASGVLDTTKKQVMIGGKDCAKDVSQIKLDVDAKDQWTTISEISLFTQTKTPPVEPPVCPPNSYWDEKLQKCVSISNPINGTTIVNSTIILDVKSSTVTINADSTSKVNTNQAAPQAENSEEEDED